MGASGTLTFNLDFTDPVTEIGLMFGATNGGTDNKEAPIERCISKIEIVDGGEVLWDLPGDVALAAYAHLRNGLPENYRTEVGSDTPYQAIPIRFGRYLYDPEYAFNPSGHRNPQLKITFDEATVRAAGGDGYVSDSFVVSILAKLMEDAAPPGGFLSFRDIYQFTSLASGDTRVELPTDRVIRLLVVRAYEAETDMRSTLTNLKLSADGGKFIPFDLPIGDVIHKMAEGFDPIVVPVQAVVSNATRTETWVGIDQNFTVDSGDDGVIVSPRTTWPGALYPYVFNTDGTAQTDKRGNITVVGWCMHNTVLYPFGRLDVPEDWLNVGQYRQLDLFCTNGDADAEVNVAVQQVYRY